jgi:hypothetical protein
VSSKDNAYVRRKSNKDSKKSLSKKDLTSKRDSVSLDGDSFIFDGDSDSIPESMASRFYDNYEELIEDED